MQLMKLPTSAVVAAPAAAGRPLLAGRPAIARVRGVRGSGRRAGGGGGGGSGDPALLLAAAPPRAASDDAAGTSGQGQGGADSSSKSRAEATTEKYGLEAGLYQALTAGEDELPQGADGRKVSRTEQAKRLLAQYGSAYLLTSISFAIVSFAACYAAVSAGVDVAGLLARVGLSVNDTSEKVGTFAIAYAAHKALSPVRFPPTVALTPVVARWTGRAPKAAPDSEQQQQQQ